MLNKGYLSEIFKTFFSLGVIAFGGPAAHIALLHREIVDKKKWMSEQKFLDLMGATSLIPGPNSTEMVIHCGFHRAGVLGLIVSGLSFLIPACALTLLLAVFYEKLGDMADIENYLLGIKVVVVILIISALKKMWTKAIKNYDHLSVAVLVLVLCLMGVGEIASLFLGTILGFAYQKIKSKTTFLAVPIVSIFFIFLKIGSILFGSGYVLISYLQDELVHKHGWITTAQLADAIGIGQFTPGPVLSTSTFIGYLLGGYTGAIVATVGIFLPAFLLVYFVHSYVDKLRQSRSFSVILDCVNAASLGVMAYALVPLSKLVFNSWHGPVNLIIMLIVFLKFPKLNSIYLVILGLVTGLILGIF